LDPRAPTPYTLGLPFLSIYHNINVGLCQIYLENNIFKDYLWQVGGFLLVLRIPPPKLTARI
jgi:hypothetical protein